MPMTMGNGMSRWVMSTSWPCRRSRARGQRLPDALDDPERRIFSSVQIAATAIAPAFHDDPHLVHEYPVDDVGHRLVGPERSGGAD